MYKCLKCEKEIDLEHVKEKIRCPFCGYKPEPESRAKPEFVDGDLFELSPEAPPEQALRKRLNTTNEHITTLFTFKPLSLLY